MVETLYPTAAAHELEPQPMTMGIINRQGGDLFVFVSRRRIVLIDTRVVPGGEAQTGLAPPWWDWQLDLSDHTYENMPVRGFTEVDLRRMMEHAIDYRPDIEEGRGESKRGSRGDSGRSSLSRYPRRNS